jgi:hypothetical protein
MFFLNNEWRRGHCQLPPTTGLPTKIRNFVENQNPLYMNEKIEYIYRME